MEEFVRIINNIPAKVWQSSLPIGSLVKIRWYYTEERKFTRLAKIEIIGSQANHVVFVKQNRRPENLNEEQFKQQMQKHYQAARFWSNVFDGNHQFRAAHLIYFDAKNGLMATEEIPGITFSKLVERAAGRLSNKAQQQKLLRASKMVGGWLQEKNKRTVVKGQLLQDEKLIQYVDVRLKILCTDKRRNIPPVWRDKILNYLENVLPTIPKEQRWLAMSHGDFNPGNILVSENCVTGFDYASPVADSYLLDASKLYHQIGLWGVKPIYSPKILHQTQQALLEGFGEPAAEITPLFKVLFLLHTVNHFMTLTSYWQYRLPERLFNRYVLNYERKKLLALCNLSL